MIKGVTILVALVCAGAAVGHDVSAQIDAEREAAHPYCLTPLRPAFEQNLETDSQRGDPQRLAAMSRPELSYKYVSPGGYFAIHYAINGPDSIQEAHIDTLAGGDGVPDFINQVAVIADSIWEFEVDSLGYREARCDGADATGDGPEYDIYFADILGWFAGYTDRSRYLDQQRVTSFIVMDSDARTCNQTDNPLDAIRFVLAHEFFHAIQLGMDRSEPSAWMEMSATWMETTVYPNLCLYTQTLPYHFDHPWVSLHDFSTSRPLHCYSEVVFPIFLTEMWGRDIIQDIWIMCQVYGEGPHFLRAVDFAISDRSDDEYDLASAWLEFAIWNLFTGDRHAFAPDGIGFASAADYPGIPDSVLLTHTAFPIEMPWPNWPESLSSYEDRLPWNLGAAYVKLDGLMGGDAMMQLELAGDEGIEWRFAAVGLPDDPADTAVIVRYDPEDGHSVSAAFDARGLASCYLIATPVDRGLAADEVGWGFSYAADLASDVNDASYDALPRQFAATQNYPNPFNDRTVIEYDLPRRSHVRVDVFNVLGQRVCTLEDAIRSAGRHKVAWSGESEDGQAVSSGVYFYRVATDQGVTARRMTLLK